jgi:hypothetical protein
MPARKEILKGEQDTHLAAWYAEYLIGHGIHLFREDRHSNELLVNFLRKTEKPTGSAFQNRAWESMPLR